MRYHLMRLALFALLLSCQAIPNQDYPRSIAEQHSEAIGILGICVGAQEISIFTGSGVIVDEHRVLTAGHVATGHDGMACTWQGVTIDGNEFVLIPSVIDHERDLATMTTLAGTFGYTHVSYGHVPDIGDLVCEVSASPYHIRRCGEGQYVKEHRLTSTMIVEPGNSGSGVYDAFGRLVGITVQSFTCGNGQYCGSIISLIDSDELSYLETGRKYE